ncbi:MAG: phytoene desaturase family protein [Bacteroidota bacterium]
MTKAIVIGAGFSGLATATTLASKGFDVTVLEKNQSAGGRARKFYADGFTFDMGPSWYWMPDVFDNYFARFGKKTADYYTLDRLDPSYTIVFGENDFLDIPADPDAFRAMLEELEPGSSAKLDKFLSQAAYKYQVGINDLVYKPSRSVFEFVDIRLLTALFRMDVFTSFHKHIRKFFKNEKILQLMEFPILFLGALPQNTPALYSLMNYADISLGTWYPRGGMHKIIEGMVKLAEEKGVKFVYDCTVKEFDCTGGNIKKVNTQNSEGETKTYEAEVVVGSADYHHIESEILPQELRSYSEEYWDKRTMAPSSLIFYLGVNKKLENLRHHNLFFDVDFMQHAKEIYETPRWPQHPLFYLSVVSKTDPNSAPEGCENLFVLVPVAHDLDDNEEIREKYYNIVMERLEKLTGQSVRDAVIYKRSYAHNDFKKDYNAFKGNAYGLANTLRQTAILKPSLKSKKVKNLYYAGQLTVPGPGVPPTLISGQVVAEEIEKDFKK